MKIAMLLLLASTATWGQAPGGGGAPAQGSPTQNQLQDAQTLNQLVSQVRASAEKSDGDVARLRIDKWKADAAGKQQATASAASIRRNLTNAVPDLLQRIQAAPGSLNANFRLYRNMNALYDTFSALVEEAGAFGTKEQYEPLAADVARLDQLRHQVAERVDLLAGANDAELARLRTQIAAAAAGAKPAPKIVVDDDQQAKAKPKKKAAAKPASGQATGQPAPQQAPK